jgi:nucleoside-diphosphate-sugar epimerase
VSYAPQDEDLLLAVNVQGTAAIVDACLERPGIRLAHVSSVAALGRPLVGTPAANGVLTITEAATWDLGAAHPAYATSKYLGELEVWRGVAEGLSAIVVNPSVVLGPGDWHRSSTRLLRYAYQQHRFYTRGLVNFVDVRDVVAQLLALALDRPALSGERYILSAEALPLADFFRQVAAVMRRRPPTVAVPNWAAEIIWRLEHARAVLTGARPLITKDTARAGREPVVYAHAKVQSATGLGFRPLADTMAWCAAELMANPTLASAVVVS